MEKKMKFTLKKTTTIASFLLLATFANPLAAQTAIDYSLGWYLGGNVGVSDANIDENEITKNLSNYTYTDDDDSHGYKLFGGYQFNKYFALEGGYFNLGKFDYALSKLSAPTGSINANMKVEGINLDAVAILPITDKFSAFGRVGANYAHTKDSFSTTGSFSVADANPKKSDLNYKYGAGFEYAITDAMRLRIEGERYRINDARGDKGDIDLYSVGLVYRFGVPKKASPLLKKEVRVAPIVQEEEKVEVSIAAPEDEAKVKEAVVKEKTVVLTLENIYFKFNESELNDEAKDTLKRYISLLNKNPKARVNLKGYTSASGTDEYNQALSERRAQSVKDYLIKENLFSEDKITTIGYGDTRPLKYEANEDNIRSKAAKANMRVIIEVKQK